MTSQIFLADVRFSLGDESDKFHAIQNPNQARADEFACNGQCGAVIKRAEERLGLFHHRVHGDHREDFNRENR